MADPYPATLLDESEIQNYGLGGKIKQEIYITVPGKSKFHTESATGFGNIKQQFKHCKLFWTALQFVFHSLNAPSLGSKTSNNRSTLFFDEPGVSCSTPKFEIFLELLVENPDLDDSELYDEENICGYRFRIVIYDPLFSFGAAWLNRIDQTIMDAYTFAKRRPRYEVIKFAIPPRQTSTTTPGLDDDDDEPGENDDLSDDSDSSDDDDGEKKKKKKKKGPQFTTGIQVPLAAPVADIVFTNAKKYYTHIRSQAELIRGVINILASKVVEDYTIALNNNYNFNSHHSRAYPDNALSFGNTLSFVLNMGVIPEQLSISNYYESNTLMRFPFPHLVYKLSPHKIADIFKYAFPWNVGRFDRSIKQVTPNIKQTLETVAAFYASTTLRNNALVRVKAKAPIAPSLFDHVLDGMDLSLYNLTSSASVVTTSSSSNTTTTISSSGGSSGNIFDNPTIADEITKDIKLSSVNDAELSSDRKKIEEADGIIRSLQNRSSARKKEITALNNKIDNAITKLRDLEVTTPYSIKTKDDLLAQLEDHKRQLKLVYNVLHDESFRDMVSELHIEADISTPLRHILREINERNESDEGFFSAQWYSVDVTISRFGNMKVRDFLILDAFMAITFVHKTIDHLMTSAQQVFFDTDNRIHNLLFAHRGYSKSHAMTVVENCAPEGTIGWADGQSDQADIIDGNQEHKVTFSDEMPKYYVDPSTSHGGNIDAANRAKSVLTRGRIDYKQLVHETNPVTGKAGRNQIRILKRHREMRTGATNRIPTNESEGSMLDRFWVTTHAIPTRPMKKSVIRNANVKLTDDQQSNKKVAEEFFSERHILVAMAAILMQGTSDIVLPSPDTSYGDFLLGYLIEILEPLLPDMPSRMRLCSTIRLKMETETLIQAIDRVFYSELRVIKKKTFVLKDLLALKPHLFCFADTAIFVITSAISQFVNPVRCEILLYLACKYCNYDPKKVPVVVDPYGAENRKIMSDYKAKGKSERRRFAEELDRELAEITQESDPVAYKLNQLRKNNEIIMQNELDLMANIYGKYNPKKDRYELPNLFDDIFNTRVQSYTRVLKHKEMQFRHVVKNKVHFMDPNYVEFDATFESVVSDSTSMKNIQLGKKLFHTELLNMKDFYISVPCLKLIPTAGLTKDAPRIYSYDGIPTDGHEFDNVSMPVLIIERSSDPNKNLFSFSILIKALELSPERIAERFVDSARNHFSSLMRIAIGDTYQDHPELLQTTVFKRKRGKVLDAPNPLYNPEFCYSRLAMANKRLKKASLTATTSRMFGNQDPEAVLYQEFLVKQNLSIIDNLSNLAFAYCNSIYIENHTNPELKERANMDIDYRIGVLRQIRGDLNNDKLRAVALRQYYPFSVIDEIAFRDDEMKRTARKRHDFLDERPNCKRDDREIIPYTSSSEEIACNPFPGSPLLLHFDTVEDDTSQSSDGYNLIPMV